MGAKRGVREPEYTLGAVIVCAGSSSRMQGLDKMYAPLEDVPVAARSIRAFCGVPYIGDVVVVCRADCIAQMWDIVRAFDLFAVSQIVAGGATRQESVFAGAQALDEACTHIAIHDGARPFVSGAVIDACMRSALEHRAATASVAVKDTIKEADGQGFIVRTPPRERLYAAQTPQVFERALYEEAMQSAIQQGITFTDDCQLIEHLGQRVALAPGSPLNFKLTTPEDFILAQAVAAGEIY